MATGWDKQKGELTRYHVALDQYWAFFNYVFSDACKKRSTYKFGLIKAIIDSLYSAELTQRGMELTYDQLFAKFTENYWNLVANYRIKQMKPDGKSTVSKLEKNIFDIRNKQPAAIEIAFEMLSDDDRKTLILQIKTDCKKNVIGALHNDFKENLYGFDNHEERIWLHICAYQFLMTYKLEIEQMNYYAWARFLEKLNANNPPIRLIENLELSTPQRKDLSPYRKILQDEFETNNCFYCGKKLTQKAHVDHVLPWSFIKSDHLWNFVLACPNCNGKKSDYLPTKQTLANVVNRNEILRCRTLPFIQNEFKGYTEDLMWKIWDYAHNQGYYVYKEE